MDTQFSDKTRKLICPESPVLQAMSPWVGGLEPREGPGPSLPGPNASTLLLVSCPLGLHLYL